MDEKVKFINAPSIQIGALVGVGSLKPNFNSFFYFNNQY
jgi:hypothetical protein